MSVQVKLKYLYNPIQKDIDAFEELLAQTLTSNFPRIQDVLDDVLSSKGKRLRPALLFFNFYAGQAEASKAPGGGITNEETRTSKPNEEKHGDMCDEKSSRRISPEEKRASAVKIAVAIELLHMASLVHDDIIDGAEVRHNRPSMHAKWGQNIGVVLGVHLYSLSLKLISEVGNLIILERVSQTVRAMCEGEMVQVLERKNADLSLPKYLTILKKKTGVLFGLACECGYLLGAGQGARLKARQMKNFGLNLGVVYQIVDDYLDITGDEKTLGKKPGQDFELGEVTLPLIYMFQTLPQEEVNSLWESHDSPETLDIVQTKLKETDEYANRTKSKGLELLQKCQAYVDGLGESVYKKRLGELVAYTEHRGFR